MEFGIDTLGFHRQIVAGKPLEQVFEEIAATGAQWVQANRCHLRGDEALSRVAALGQKAAELGLRVIWSGDSLGQASWTSDQGLERIRTGAEQAAACGARILRMYPGWFRFEAISTGTLNAELQYLRALVEAAVPLLERAGVILAVENHANLRAEELADLVRSVDSPHVRVHLDLVNQTAAFEDPITVAATLAPYVVSVHAKDVAQVSEWGTESYYRMGYFVRYCWPGEGIFPLGDVLGALFTCPSARDVPVILEGLDEPENPVEKARRSFEYLGRIIAAVASR